MRRRSMLTFFAPVLVMSIVGCRGQDELLAALPTSEDVAIEVPGNEAQNALALGETSEFYEATWNVSRSINGGIGFVFHLIEAIIQHPPTVEEENRKQWGPSEPEGLERNSFMFVAEKVEEGHFSYALSARPKGSEDDADWRVVFDGEAFPADGEKGTGTLNLYFDTMNELNDDCHVGTAIVTYDTTLPDERRQVDVDFNQFQNTCDPNSQNTIATYHYAENGDASGDFEFSFNGDIHANDEEPKPLLETFTLKSRWLGTGAGRSDVIISGGEVPGDLATHLPDSGAESVKASECWDDLFNLTYSDTDPPELRDIIRPQLGDASACPFEDASYPVM